MLLDQNGNQVFGITQKTHESIRKQLREILEPTEYHGKFFRLDQRTRIIDKRNPTHAQR